MSPETTRRSEALRLLGLARRAGSVVVGVDGTRRALRAGEVYLVLIAEDGSKVQKDKIEGLVRARGIPRCPVESREALGASLGEPPLTAVGVTDRRLAGEVRKRLGGDARDR